MKTPNKNVRAQPEICMRYTVKLFSMIIIWHKLSQKKCYSFLSLLMENMASTEILVKISEFPDIQWKILWINMVINPDILEKILLN